MLIKPSNLYQNSPRQGFYRKSTCGYGPQLMNISRPLSRASVVAEMEEKYQVPRHNRPFALYHYPFPRIPRPKRNVLYYSTWAKGGSSLMKNKNKLGFSRLKITRRLISSANQKIRNKTTSFHKRFFSEEARTKRQQRRRFIRWWTLTSLTIVLGGVAAKIRYEKGEQSDECFDEHGIRPQSWHLYAYSTLPLKAISRIWGQVNSINLPVWIRSPSYKLYSAIFGVNLDEIAEPDLTTYKNLSEFFYRQLKPGVRPIADSEVISPSDGTILKYGVIENGQIEQVKGMTYSVDALLGLNTGRLAAPSHSLDFEQELDDISVMERDQEFAKINGISYTADDLIGGEGKGTYHMNELQYKDKGDGTAKESKPLFSDQINVAKSLAPLVKEGFAGGEKQLCFAVIYLAPGDYHRFHSPANWVATLRRHFIGELFSVAPFFQKTLQGLFVLNERVALLGYWKYGFFSMVPVGATNVGSIIVNFDKYLKTNDVYEHEVYLKIKEDPSESTPLLDERAESASDLASKFSTSSSSSAPKKLKKNTVYEATYTKASSLLGGYPLTKGQEVGGFKLGSTVVLIFEAPQNFKFNLKVGQKVKMGQSLGIFS